MEIKNNSDRRVMKTKRAIHSAFAELFSTRDLKDITVRDIATLAHINRKTFYNHYNDIDELIDELENEIIQAFDKALSGIDLREALENPEDICRRLLAIGYECQDICSHMMKLEYDGIMVRKVSDALINSIKKSSAEQIHVSDEVLQMMIDFAVAGMLQTYQTWFNSDRSISVENLSLGLSHVIVNGFNGVLKMSCRDEIKGE